MGSDLYMMRQQGYTLDKKGRMVERDSYNFAAGRVSGLKWALGRATDADLRESVRCEIERLRKKWGV